MVVIIQVSTWKQFNINTHNTTMNESTAANNVFVGHQNLCQGVFESYALKLSSRCKFLYFFSLKNVKIAVSFNDNEHKIIETISNYTKYRIYGFLTISFMNSATKSKYVVQFVPVKL